MTAKQFRIGLNCLGHTKKLVAVKFAYEKVHITGTFNLDPR